MAKKQGPQPDAYPSAALLAELQALGREAETPSRNHRAWRLVVEASANPDFPAVFDFAVENDLVTPFDAEPPSRRRAPAVNHATWVNPADASEMIWVPPGPFVVGSKKRAATCKGFSLARHPITNLQFERFLDETKYRPPKEHPDNALFLSHWRGGRCPANLALHPVVWVSYLDALEYCRWAGLTLPTQWLWEKAARGPEGRPFPWGEGAPSRREALCNVESRSTCEVGRYPRTRSPYGCEDLIGNVSEWCQAGDEKDLGLMPPGVPDAKPPDGKKGVLTEVRGSCFLREDPRRMVAWHRRRLSVARRNQWVGFRPASFLPCRPKDKF
jgi:serine/threonine-protein kinase